MNNILNKETGTLTLLLSDPHTELATNKIKEIINEFTNDGASILLYEFNSVSYYKELKLNEAELKEAKIYLGQSQFIEDMNEIIIEHKKLYDIKYVVVDGLDVIQARKKYCLGRADIVSIIIKQLKELAQEQKISIVATAPIPPKITNDDLKNDKSKVLSYFCKPETAQEYIDEIILLKEEELKGISTGFNELDSIIAGLHKSSLNVIASRPAMGKTSLMFNIAVNIAKKEKVPVAIFSLEMSKEQCISRIISSEALVPYSKFIKENLDGKNWANIAEATAKLLEVQIFIDDTPGISVGEIREKCIKLKQEKNLGLVVIDYFQLVSANKEANREQELSDVSRSLKKLSQELEIPILVTSQLSRKPENRHDKGQDPRPTLKDFKYSGALVQDADVIMFLYRDNYYYLDSAKGDIAEIRVAKNKFGKLGTAEVLWLSEYMKFANLENHN